MNDTFLNNMNGASLLDLLKISPWVLVEWSCFYSSWSKKGNEFIPWMNCDKYPHIG